MDWKMLENFEKYLYSLKREGDRKKKIVIDEIKRNGERDNERDRERKGKERNRGSKRERMKGRDKR
jgi:hypothetical protein